MLDRIPTYPRNSLYPLVNIPNPEWMGKKRASDDWDSITERQNVLRVRQGRMPKKKTDKTATHLLHHHLDEFVVVLFF
jgi:hypothetical protein